MKSQSPIDIKDLEKLASLVRQDVIENLYLAGSGHVGGSLGVADILVALYFSVMNIDPASLKDPKRDRFLLSAGHLCPALYATLAHRGFFPHDELATLRNLGSRLPGHPHNLLTPGIETSSGPLGQGLSQGIGMALAGRSDNLSYHTFVLLSDGEHQEGQTWEAIMFAGKEKLNRLIAIVDRNKMQIDGGTEQVMPLEPLADKYKAFNWDVIEVEGNKMESVLNGFSKAVTSASNPVVMIAHTQLGFGVDFIQGDYKWHGLPPQNEAQVAKALEQLRQVNGMVVEHPQEK